MKEPSDDRLRERAAELVVEGEAPSRQSDDRLREFLLASPKNVAEYLRMSALWDALGQPEMESTARRAARPGGVTIGLRVAAAAAVLMVVALMGWRYAEGRRGEVHRTAEGQVTSLQLEDRSVVFMNSGSELSVLYSTRQRRVILHSGEAAFDVARSPDRPFVVESGAARVTAVGTEFVVRRRASQTTVTVLEGEVRVEGDFELVEGPSASEAAADGLPLGPGSRLQVNDSGTAHATPVGVREVASWRQHRLIFDADELRAVAAEFNRLNTTEIVISDEALGGLKISGVFDASDPGSLLAFLRGLEGVEVTIEAGGAAVVHAESAPPRR